MNIKRLILTVPTLEKPLPVDFRVAAKQARECATELSAVNAGVDSELIASKIEHAAIGFEKLYSGKAIQSKEKPFHLLYSVLTIMCNRRDVFPKEKFEGLELIIADLANMDLDKQVNATKISQVQTFAWMQHADQEKYVPSYLPEDNEPMPEEKCYSKSL